MSKIGLAKTDFRNRSGFRNKNVSEVIRELIGNNSVKNIDIRAVYRLNGAYFSFPFWKPAQIF